MNWITKIVLNGYNARYDGLKVGLEDTEKVLLWWKTLDHTENYRVFYGDLRTEIVTDEKWNQLVSTEDAQRLE